MCLHCYTAEVIFIPPHRRHIRTHLRSKILAVVEVVAIAQWGGDDDTSCSGNVGVYPFTRTRCVGVVGMFVEIPFVSMYAFWVAVLAYVVLALGNFLTPLKSRP